MGVRVVWRQGGESQNPMQKGAYKAFYPPPFMKGSSAQYMIESIKHAAPGMN